MYRAIILRNAESSGNIKNITVIENLPMTGNGRDAMEIVKTQTDELDKVFFIDDKVSIDYLRFDASAGTCSDDRRYSRPHTL